MITIKSMVQIPKRYLRDDWMDFVKAELTLAVLDAEGSTEFQPLWEESKDEIRVPRHYGYRVLLNALYPEIDVSVARPPTFNYKGFVSKGKYGFQNELVAKLCLKIGSDLATKGFAGGILCSPCGSGKTIVGMMIAAEYGTKTLIVVNKEFLAEQWEAAAKLVMGSYVKIGRIQSGAHNIDDADIVIAMIQSLTSPSQDYSVLKDEFGMMIVDETHRIGSNVWRRAAGMFNPAIRLGLSATPRRSDGADSVFWLNIGPLYATVKPEDIGHLSAEVHVVNTQLRIDKGTFAWCYQKGQLDLRRALGMIVKNKARNDLIGFIMNQALRKKRKVLLLSHRLEHLERFMDIVESLPQPPTCSYYVGGLNKSEREQAEKSQCILATYQMAKEGLDIPDLDVLILATPIADVQQPIGRILRNSEGKKQPIVVDICDPEVPALKGMFGTRTKWYDRLDYKVIYPPDRVKLKEE